MYFGLLFIVTLWLVIVFGWFGCFGWVCLFWIVPIDCLGFVECGFGCLCLVCLCFAKLCLFWLRLLLVWVDWLGLYLRLFGIVLLFVWLLFWCLIVCLCFVRVVTWLCFVRLIACVFAFVLFVFACFVCCGWVCLICVYWMVWWNTLLCLYCLHCVLYLIFVLVFEFGFGYVCRLFDVVWLWLCLAIVLSLLCVLIYDICDLLVDSSCYVRIMF